MKLGMSEEIGSKSAVSVPLAIGILQFCALPILLASMLMGLEQQSSSGSQRAPTIVSASVTSVPHGEWPALKRYAQYIRHWF